MSYQASFQSRRPSAKIECNTKKLKKRKNHQLKLIRLIHKNEEVCCKCCLFLSSLFGDVFLSDRFDDTNSDRLTHITNSKTS